MAVFTVAESHFRQAFNTLGLRTRQSVIDLGSLQFKTINWSNHQHIVPAGFVRQVREKHIVKFGKPALEMVGKLSPNFELVWPIQKGRPTSQDSLIELLQVILADHENNVPLRYKVVPRQLLLVVSPTVSQLERRMIRAFGQTLYATTQICNSDRAVFASWRQLFPKQPAGIIVNCGAHKTEVTVISQQELFRTRTIPIAGEQLTEAIIQAVRQESQLQVGWHTAEKVKHELVSVNQPDSRKKMVVRGKDVLTSYPESREVVAAHLNKQIEKVLSQLVEAIKYFFHELPPEVVSESAEYPLYLTGGGSVLSGLAPYLTQQLHVEIVRSKEPIWDVVQGAKWLATH